MAIPAFSTLFFDYRKACELFFVAIKTIPLYFCSGF